MKQEKFLELLKKYLKGDDDETIKDLEELTAIDVESKFTQADIDKAVKEKDTEWRTRYKERFFGKNEDFDKQFENKKKTDKNKDEEKENDEITFDDILKEKESE